MYKFFVTYLIFFIGFLVKAQNISGRVLDQNKNPIEGVHVYLDNTSIVTLTNANGNYILYNPKNISSNIVFRLIGYQSKVLKQQQQLIVYLQDDVSDLEELIIKKSKFTRQQLIQVFKDQFLGTTNFGKACKILNEQDLELSYDPDTFTLETNANNVIKIYNPLLGYNIEFDLKESKTHYNSYSIDPNQIKQNLFIGSTLFKDAKFVSDIALKNRQYAYEGSIQHFFSELVNPDSKMSQFKSNVSDIKYSFNIENLNDDNFLITPKLSDNKIQIEGLVKKEKTKFYYKIQYKNLNSIIYIDAKELIVNKNGNYSPIQQVILAGEMSKHRLGNMLPLNFEFTK